MIGGGYHLNITKAPGTKNGPKIVALLETLVPDTLLKYEDDHELTIHLPSECTPYFPNCFEVLEKQTSSLGIIEMTLSHTLMNEIFKK